MNANALFIADVRPKDKRFRGQHPGGHRHPHERHIPLGHRRLQVRRGREQEREVNHRHPESVSGPRLRYS